MTFLHIVNAISVALIFFTCTVCILLPSCLTVGDVAALSMNMNRNAGTGKSRISASIMDIESTGSRPSPRKQSAADTMALKIGLNVVPKRNKGPTKEIDIPVSERTPNSIKTAKVKRIKVPKIIWGKTVKNFFWSNEEDYDEQIKQSSHHNNPLVSIIENEQNFPLYLLRNVLPPQSLERVLSLATDPKTMHDAEEMEQHELIGGEPRTLRRSLVKRLKYNQNELESKHDTSREILDMVVSGLPPDLVRKGMMRANPNKKNHSYEDGSIVYYRSAERDFYHAHHDSYAPGDPVRERQRAYTILLYLRAPPASPWMGGTEFPRLTPLPKTAAVKNGTNLKQKRGLVVKPQAGDALVWPNFDQEGNPYVESIHSALPLGENGQNIINNNDAGIGKIVINLWFEG